MFVFYALTLLCFAKEEIGKIKSKCTKKQNFKTVDPSVAVNQPTSIMKEHNHFSSREASSQSNYDNSQSEK